MRVQAYSAIYGGYDHPKDVREAGFTHKPIMFTDNSPTWSECFDMGWRPVLTPPELLHIDYPTDREPASIIEPMLNHKWWKCHPEVLSDYAREWPHTPPIQIDASIWLDGSVQPHPGFEEKALAALGEDDWSCVPHPSRSCIHPEAYYSATLTWRYDGLSILAQANHSGSSTPRGTAWLRPGSTFVAILPRSSSCPTCGGRRSSLVAPGPDQPAGVAEAMGGQG